MSLTKHNQKSVFRIKINVKIQKKKKKYSGLLTHIHNPFGVDSVVECTVPLKGEKERKKETKRWVTSRERDRNYTCEEGCRTTAQKALMALTFPVTSSFLFCFFLKPA